MATNECNGNRIFVLADSDEYLTADLIAGICGISDALYGPVFDDVRDDTAQMMIQGLKVLTDPPQRTLDIPLETEGKLEAALSDSDREQAAV